jgi:hypothetical protein
LKGRVTVSADYEPAEIPHPTPDFSPINSALVVPESFCIDDMRLEIDMLPEIANSVYGVDLGNLAPYLRISIETDSGATMLWNHNLVPENWDVPTTPYSYTLAIDQFENSAPDDPGLSLFNGSDSAGEWRIKIWDDRPPEAQQVAAMMGWRVVLAGSPGICP